MNPVLKKRLPLAIAVAAVLASLWAVKKFNEYRFYRAAERETERLKRQAPDVKAYKVRPQDVAGTLRRIGTVRARAETNLQFGAAGRVGKFDAEKGQFIKKGALIAALDQAEARNMLQAAEMEFQKASEKYFSDRTIERLDFERAKARYNQARIEAAKTTIHAPHDGYLVEKWINAGEHASPETVIGKLMDKGRVFVEMDLSEDDIQFLKVQQKVEITVDAVPGFKDQGEVAAITPYLKGDTRSFNVKVNLTQNPEEKLNPGMFARCAVRRYEKAGALTVPLDAGAEMQGKTMRIFVVDGDNRARAKTVDVLFMDEGLVEVSGLSEGDLVILHPPADLAEGAAVRVQDVFDPAAHAPAAVPTAG